MSSNCKTDKWYPVRMGVVVVVFVVMIFTIGGAILDTHSGRNHAQELKDDIKARCRPIYNTIDGKWMTTIYSCPAEDGGDDVKYEFTEHL